MGMKQLSDDDIKKVYQDLGTNPVLFCPDIDGAIARKAEQEILEQVIEWGDDMCPHALAEKASNKDPWVKRECLDCWQELKKEIE